MLAFSIMFFGGALLCFLLGWADGVRRDKTFLHIPESGSFLVAAAILAAQYLRHETPKQAIASERAFRQPAVQYDNWNLLALALP